MSDDDTLRCVICASVCVNPSGLCDEHEYDEDEEATKKKER